MQKLAILQARMSSSRLPGKILKLIVGKPMLSLQIERTMRARLIDQLVIATSTDKSDDPVEQLCRQLSVACFRGNLDNVLDRYYHAAKQYRPEIIVRLTGDCPLADPLVIDGAIQYFLDHGLDYVTNCGSESTFPDGLDVEIFTFEALKTAWENAQLPSEKEHVTPYIRNRQDRFKTGIFKGKPDRSHMRWTVDEPKDFEFVSRIYQELYFANSEFDTSDILDLLNKKPELMNINASIGRDEGFQKSLKIDEEYRKRMHDPKSSSRKKSLALQDKAKNLIPGLSQLLSKRPDMFAPGVWPGYFSKAKGAEVWDLDGNRYIDMSISGIGANVLGYADPDVDAAVKKAIDNGTSSSLNCPEDVELAELLCRLHPWAAKARFARSGGEAMAIAVRIARAYTGLDKIAFCGYHGWHDWYLSANLGTDEDALGTHLISGLDPCGVPKGLTGTALPFRYNHIEELQDIVKKHGKEIGAIVMEPVRSEIPENGFLEQIRSLADQIGAVLIVDEISAGFRLNTGGAHMKLGLVPDMAVFSKALGNGYAMAAVIGKSAVMEAAQKTFISSTNWTERIGPVAAIATITKHEKYDVGTHLVRMWDIIRNGLEKIATRHDVDIHIGGILPIGHFSFNYPEGLCMKSLFVQMMIDRGYLASTSYYAMYAHTEQHCRDYLEAVDEVFGIISSLRKEGKIEQSMAGKPASSGFTRLV